MCVLAPLSQCTQDLHSVFPNTIITDGKRRCTLRFGTGVDNYILPGQWNQWQPFDMSEGFPYLLHE